MSYFVAFHGDGYNDYFLQKYKQPLFQRQLGRLFHTQQLQQMAEIVVLVDGTYKLNQDALGGVILHNNKVICS